MKNSKSNDPQPVLDIDDFTYVDRSQNPLPVTMEVLKHTVLVIIYKQEISGNTYYVIKYVINNTNGTYRFEWQKDYYWTQFISDFVNSNAVPDINITASYISYDRNNYIDILLQQSDKYIPSGTALELYDMFDTDYYLIKKIDPDASDEIRPAGMNLQEKDVSITTNTTTTVEPDTGYNGLSEVVVTTNVQPNLQNKTVNITTNGTNTINPDLGYDGLSSVDCNVNVQQNLQYKSFTYRSNGTREVRPDSGYTGLSGVDVNVDVEPNLQNKQVWITNNGTSNFSADSSYQGINNIQVNVDVPTSGTTNYTLAHLNKSYTTNGTFSVDAPTGYDGFYSGGTITVNVPTSSGTTVNLQSNKTVQQNDYINQNSNIVVTPDSGYDGLQQVTVEPIKLDTASYNTITSNGVTTIYPSTGSRGFLGSIAVDVNVPTPTPTVEVPQVNYIAYGSPSDMDGLLNDQFELVVPKYSGDPHWYDGINLNVSSSTFSYGVSAGESIIVIGFSSNKWVVGAYYNNSTSATSIVVPVLFSCNNLRYKRIRSIVKYIELCENGNTNSSLLRIKAGQIYDYGRGMSLMNCVVVYDNCMKFDNNYTDAV